LFAAGFREPGQRLVKPAFGDQGGGFLAQVAGSGQGETVEARIWPSGKAPLNSTTSWPW
jgi:hypothetical protein